MPKAGQPDIPGVTSEAGNPKPSFPILAVGGLVLLGGLAFFLLRKKRKR
jgi:LPXTG-motif cell wall-anchored protein